MKIKIKAGTIIRITCLLLALVNQVLQASGNSIIPISDEQVSELITLLFTICTALWACWKNNSITQEALKADEMLESMRIAKKADMYE